MCGQLKWNWRDSFLEEEFKSGEVIEGPWKKRSIKLPSEIEAELEIKKEFAEDLTQELIVHMIQMSNDNGIDVSNETFSHDVGIIIEFAKGMVFRGVGLEYPTQYIVDTFVDVVTDPDGTRHTEVDLEVLLQASKIFSDDEE